MARNHKQRLLLVSDVLTSLEELTIVFKPVCFSSNIHSSFIQIGTLGQFSLNLNR